MILGSLHAYVAMLDCGADSGRDRQDVPGRGISAPGYFA